MTIYIINEKLGAIPSGIEISEKYRLKMFRDAGHQAMMIFTDFTKQQSIQDYYEALGFSGEYVDMFHYLTNRTPRKKTDDCWEVISEVEAHHYFYEDTLYYKEIYEIIGGFDELTQRIFYDEEGQEVLVQYMQYQNIAYDYQGQYYSTHQDLLVHFYNLVGFEDNDVVFFDRVEGITPAFFFSIASRKNIKTYINIMSEHMLNGEWNPGYRLLPHLSDKVTGFIVQTQAQKEALQQSLQQSQCVTNNIFVAQMNCSPEIHPQATNPNRHGFMTASRLAPEKNLLALVEQVILAHDQDDSITLDIYGGGLERAALESLIEDIPYIRLMGHVLSMDIPYYQYKAYVSTSFGEGFGNALLEALSQGTPLIAWNKPYGFPEVIEQGVSGLLYDNVEELADLLVHFNSSDFQAGSIKRAQDYNFSAVQSRWLTLL
ncbi:glycosyltransferase [Aerococcaceae bacterium zg-BR9]|uniref:glycosyltransferase n=1 Tax=Aerococcaceae bacterium zg-1292 TaxID=2774330 RepID=UPI0040632265|nr:glycosyltransferase [Aerococcaceae bacterium zg-BR9]